MNKAHLYCGKAELICFVEKLISAFGLYILLKAVVSFEKFKLVCMAFFLFIVHVTLFDRIGFRNTSEGYLHYEYAADICSVRQTSALPDHLPAYVLLS